MIVGPRAALLAVLATACVADNPAGEDTDTEGGSGSGGVVPEDSMLGCPEGQTCTYVFAAMSFDDRVEVFAPDHPTQQYRGAIDVDLRPGRDNANLDEPVGMALTERFFHVSLGHFPTAEQGTLVSLPRSWLGAYAEGTTVPAVDIAAGGAFRDPVVPTAFGAAEPIFVHYQPMANRLLVGTFNNNLFSPETQWTEPGLLQIVDGDDPAKFTTESLVDLNGDCTGAAQVITMEDESQIAIACDGSEAVAFMTLTDDAIDGKVCPISPLPGYRMRYLAYDGDESVLVTYGPGFDTPDAAGRVYAVRRTNCAANSIDIGTGLESHPAQIVRVGNAYLVASGAPADMTSKRGIFVVRPDGTVCDQPLPGFDAFWTSPGTVPLQPFALEVAADGAHLAVGAAVNPVRANLGSTTDVYGRVLWATLSNVGDPCNMSATVVDLTDGAPGHAPASDPVDPATYRQQIYAVAVHEVQG